MAIYLYNCMKLYFYSYTNYFVSSTNINTPKRSEKMFHDVAKTFDAYNTNLTFGHVDCSKSP